LKYLCQSTKLHGTTCHKMWYCFASYLHIMVTSNRKTFWIYNVCRKINLSMMVVMKLYVYSCNPVTESGILRELQQENVGIVWNCFSDTFSLLYCSRYMPFIFIFTYSLAVWLVLLCLLELWLLITRKIKELHF
jgi:hypothetical protein